MVERTDKLEFIKIKNICSAKNVKKIKRQATRGKYLQKTHLREDYYLKDTKNSENNTKKTNHPTNKLNQDFNRHVTKEDTQMANKPMKRCSKSNAIRGVKLKHQKSHYTPIRMATRPSPQKTNTDNSKC